MFDADRQTVHCASPRVSAHRVTHRRSAMTSSPGCRDQRQHQNGGHHGGDVVDRPGSDDNPADAMQRAKQFGDGGQTPGSTERGAKATEQLGQYAGQHHGPERQATARSQSFGVFAKARIEVVERPLGIDVQNHAGIEPDKNNFRGTRPVQTRSERMVRQLGSAQCRGSPPGARRSVARCHHRAGKSGRGADDPAHGDAGQHCERR